MIYIGILGLLSLYIFLTPINCLHSPLEPNQNLFVSGLKACLRNYFPRDLDALQLNIFINTVNSDEDHNKASNNHEFLQNDPQSNLLKKGSLSSSHRFDSLLTNYDFHENQSNKQDKTTKILESIPITRVDNVSQVPLKSLFKYKGEDNTAWIVHNQLPSTHIHNILLDEQTSRVPNTAVNSETSYRDHNYTKPFSVVLVASGVGQRMNTNIPKQFLHIAGKPAISYSIDLFLNYPNLEFLIIVADTKYFTHIKELVGNDPRCFLVQGGQERSDSVYNGLKFLEAHLTQLQTPSNSNSTNVTSINVLDATKSAKSILKISKTINNPKMIPKPLVKSNIVYSDKSMKLESCRHLNNTDISSNYVVAIHDAARPCLAAEKLNKVLEEGERYGAATLSVPVLPTIKLCKKNTKFVDKTLDRDLLFDIQTPQVFHLGVLLEAYKYAKKNQLKLTDDASAMEAISYPIKLTEGDVNNIKLTHPRDLHMAHIILTHIPPNSE